MRFGGAATTPTAAAASRRIRRTSFDYDRPMQLQGPVLASPAAPLNQLLRQGLDRDPDAIAMVSIVRSMTWVELEHESSALACGYGRLGLSEGDRIASLMPNRIDLVVHYLACFKAGLVATPLNYRYTYREIDHALQVSGADALLAHVERDEDVAASALTAGLRCGVIAYRDETNEHPVSWPHSFADLLENEPLVFDPSPDPGIPAVIFFTSGSTGPAKGVTHTRESLRWMIASAVSAFELGRRPGRRRADHRRARAAAAVARESADGAGDDPGRADRAGARSRAAAR
jgi:long-chain acyl-CoA synthetase